MVSKITFEVPWENVEPGPCGEYVEVIDFDPASNCYYEPVNLNDPMLLAQDGHQPAEGNPQFHQQMVYAVTMKTIQTFEQALGRPAMWADGPNYSFVKALRVHPHALREANAYYSPNKKALLFGYFPASEDVGAGQFPGGMVFTCLSHDIVAHETSHALLDGFHPGFLQPSNDDVLAFHEAFSDLVALFQRFGFPEVLSHQIAATRGDLGGPNLMARLASEFGHAIGSRGALRDAIGKVDKLTGKWKPTAIDPSKMKTTYEPHDRGAILVAAVFDAFVQIYRSRTADLLRIASGGTGVLPQGEIHPDLVKRLAGEASKCAKHVLEMCIRALDYCPPVDLTFGEFLRALITADTDLMPADRLGYRVAFIEAFRRRGIYPEKIRTMSEDSLRWNSTDEQDIPESEREFLRPLLDSVLYGVGEIQKLSPRRKGYRKLLHSKMAGIREGIHEQIRGNLPKAFALQKITGLALGSKADKKTLPEGVRLNPDGRPRFEVRSFHESRREGEDGRMLNQVFVTMIQKRKIKSGDQEMTIHCGSTLVIDVDEQKIVYAIRKGLNSDDRIEREADFRMRLAGSTLGETYLSGGDELLASLHRHC